MNKLLFTAGFIALFAGCASKPLLPSEKDVKVSRETPTSKCQEVGPLMGRTATVRGTREEALEDLKREAANKGANYVVIKQMSDLGTAVTGVAYECP